MKLSLSWPRPVFVLCTCLATAGALLVVAAPAEAKSRVTPGNFTGYGFDQCVAPTQEAMDAWLASSPFWAVGIYISGDSRACTNQPNLSPTWVSTQLRQGWRLLPLTVGPQAACSTLDNYRDEVRISSTPDQNYAAARGQGRREALTTVQAARALGISAKSTLWYDIEAFPISGTRCRESALSFLSAWTRRLHDLGYVSGVYSSAASGIAMLDDEAAGGSRHTLPDRVWIADWNGRADIESAYVRSTSWMPHRRVHQYRGSHLERHGGVTINIDSNFMSLGRGSFARKRRPACGVGIDLPDYHTLRRGDAGAEVKALKCLLKLKGTFEGPMYRGFNRRTVKAVIAFQNAHHINPSGVATLRTWTALLSGGSERIVKYGSAGNEVRRVQRAMNAAVNAHLEISGVFTATTTSAVRDYQRLRRLPATGVVASATWAQLKRGNVKAATASVRREVGRALPD
jgi:hypothetical protein